MMCPQVTRQAKHGIRRRLEIRQTPVQQLQTLRTTASMKCLAVAVAVGDSGDTAKENSAAEEVGEAISAVVETASSAVGEEDAVAIAEMGSTEVVVAAYVVARVVELVAERQRSKPHASTLRRISRK
jgi:predicted urease superfamily metal-dependent hydrolase